MEKDNNSKDDEKIEWDNNSDNLDDVEKDNKKDSKLIRSSKNINLEQSQESQIFNTTNQNQEQLINVNFLLLIIYLNVLQQVEYENKIYF